MTKTFRRAMRFVATLAVLGTFTGSLFAEDKTVDAAPMQGKKVRLDGWPKEWPALERLSANVSGAGARAEAVAAYDDDNLYVAMRVEDSDLVRTSGMGNNEDYGALHLAFPTGAGWKSYEVRLYPGVPGKSAGAVKVQGLGKAQGSQIVEAPSDTGLTFEARVPWSVFPEAKKVRSGLRGALSYKDVDGGGKTALVASAKGTGSSLPPFTIEAEYALLRSLVYPKALSPRPTKQLTGNLVGDEMYETVSVYERYLAITGWNYRNGSEFYYQDLNVLTPANLLGIRLEDVTGDGRSEIVLRRRVGSSGDSKDFFEVWTFRSKDQGPEPLFQHETGLVLGSQKIENEVKLEKKKGKWQVVVAQGEHDGIEPSEWEGPTISGDRATLMPWETVESRRYEWDGKTFALVEEEEWEPKLRSPTGTRAPRGASGDPLPAVEERTAPAPRPPNAEELLDRVYSLYRTDRGVKKATPRFDFVTDVAAGEDTERVLVHGKDLVVFGKKFKEGTSYVYTTIGVKEAEHVLDVTARDMTGDGRAEILVRGIIPVKASEQLGGAVVTRHALMIYRVSEDGITRIFAAETGRSLDDDAILARVSFVPVSHAVRIELHRGRAVGWSEKTYPFPQDPLPYQGLEPLLLPWTELPERAYVFEGERFVLVK